MTQQVTMESWDSHSQAGNLLVLPQKEAPCVSPRMHSTHTRMTLPFPLLLLRPGPGL